MSKTVSLTAAGITTSKEIFYQLSPEELLQQTLNSKQGALNNIGALVVHTGEFTGRSPRDRFIVREPGTQNNIDWGTYNIAIAEKYFDLLLNKMQDHLADKNIWVRDCIACASEKYAINIRVINEAPWANLFCSNMFIQPAAEKLNADKFDWLIIQAPGFKANPATDGTRQHNFSIINFKRKIVLIGGSAYTGEIKKGVFTILNYTLPVFHKVLSMHCSANTGMQGDTAIFFGLSGTGKTTLSTDPDRALIGDDEHGWDDNSVFNFEGGCYAKTIGLTREREPEIFDAIREGAILENVTFYTGTNHVNYNDSSITENTRVSYPLNFIENIATPSVGGIPKNIFFLTCDAYGVLPPVSKLTAEQAMYYFISGYTARIAGTEEGVKEPQSTFSACFGAPFLPLHPFEYATLLGDKIKKHNVKVWMINTGWIGGGYGVGSRISLKYTRAMITAILNGSLENVAYQTHPVFQLQVPMQCAGVPGDLLYPKASWNNKEAYDEAAADLAKSFRENFKKYGADKMANITAAGPVVLESKYKNAV